METIIKLLNQKQEFYKSQGLQLHNLQDDYDLLNIQYGSLSDEFQERETVHAIARYHNEQLCSHLAESQDQFGILERTCNAVESLTDDLCTANDTIAKLNNESSSTAAMQRIITDLRMKNRSLSTLANKYEAAQAGMLAATKKLNQFKAEHGAHTQSKIVAPDNGAFGKKPVSQKQLRQASKNLVKENEFYKGKYKEVADMYNELVIYQQTAPTFAGDVSIGAGGNIHMIDLQWHDRDIKQADGSFLRTRAQHVICINDYSSVKTLFRIAGSDVIHVSETPPGKHLRASDKLTEIVKRRFEAYDKQYKNANGEYHTVRGDK